MMFLIPGLEEGDSHVVPVDTNGVAWMTPAETILVGMYQETAVQQVMDQVPDPHAQYGGATISVNRSVPVTKTYAILRRTRDVQVQELVSRVDFLTEEMTAGTAERLQKSEALSVLEKRFEELSRNFGQRGIELDNCIKDLATEKLAKRAGNTNLEKLRTALGELRMKEILGETK